MNRPLRQVPTIRAIPWILGGTALFLAGCDAPSPPERLPSTVRAQVATSTSRAASVTLTGEIKARVQSDLAFRFSGRIASRTVDVGDRVEAGQVLATLETTEQTADVNSATAGVRAAEATLRQARAAFQRQSTLLSNGYTTQTSYDNANQDFLSAQASLDSAKANLGTVQEQLSYTTLRADAAGVVTARNAEAGQVVDAAQAIFTIARDGGRDAVFDVYEALLARQPADDRIAITLLSNPSIRATGRVREIAPAIDPSTGTVRVKIAIDNPPPEMGLGAAVAGVGRFQARDVVVLPWTAFFTRDGTAAVWVVDPLSKAVALTSVVVDSYRTGEVLLREGLKPGDLVVTAGTQLLRPDEIVAPRLDTAPAGMGVAK
ncbi:MAG: efflux RND transporter periplasmic adaptor subunit [Mesorhizobium sp.]|uniref:efflux RND transporter periplasmic adaptor subunit n=1 Tax=Mesorhizobium sp. TaxID=1871066 RepID=UPI000FEAB32B|nr:efflux RND transporter periplasmic adaptor subunit [Mesorhizobium sp.]RWK82694.1 MAG: efflux RND transporter periplasmic adaptor subunit [Mesorhizobium sp.]RWL06501.1 MAG: efflux RND transporter periplasmic adaptor subunit [Mesorhizobium sp.]